VGLITRRNPWPYTVYGVIRFSLGVLLDDDFRNSIQDGYFFIEFFKL